MTRPKVPLPFLVLGGIIVVLIAITIAPKIHGILIVAALAAWGVVIGSLLYSSRLLPSAVKLPILGSLIKAISLPQTVTPPQPPITQGNNTQIRDNGRQAENRTTDRKKRAETARQLLMSLAGNHPAVTYILSTFNSSPSSNPHLLKQKLLLSASRAWIAIVHGPPGVGKSTIAHALAEFLIAYDLVERPIKLPLDGRIEADWIQSLESGLGGVVLVDNARWLAEANGSTQKVNGESFLATISSMADRYPGQLAIIISMTTDQKMKAFEGKVANEYKQRLTVIDHLECVGIDRESLYRFLLKYLGKHHIEMDRTLESRVLRLIGEERERETFYHVEAMQRWAERLSLRLQQEGRHIVTAADLEWLESNL